MKNAGNRVESLGFAGLNAVIGDFVAESHGLNARLRDRLSSAEWKSLEFRRFTAVLTGRFQPGAGVGGCGRGTQSGKRRESC